MVVPIVVVGSFLEHGEAARYVAMGVAKTVGKGITGIVDGGGVPVHEAAMAKVYSGELMERLGEAADGELRRVVASTAFVGDVTRGRGHGHDVGVRVCRGDSEQRQ